MIIGTAGHIDHGKSALVTALTGRAVDRLAEERRRGITIDLNFAPLELPGLPPVGIVDVPGHEDLVRTMVAGASGIDLVLLVVDAVQGPEPQTWEHLAIVEQLRVPRGIPVITKADLADPEWVELVKTELGDRLGRSPVNFREPAVVSSLTRQGIPDLLERIRAELEAAPSPSPSTSGDGFRMPIDRAFSIAGVGTVLTGTPWSGELRVGATVQVLPGGQEGRVRSLEAYGHPVEKAVPGQRAAVGVAGLERSTIRRGETLVSDRLPWRSTTALDVEAEILPDAGPLRRQARLRVLLGTAEVLARVYPRGEFAPGAPGLLRLALEAPLVARGGDRFVLRSYSPVATIGGGRVLDPFPPRRADWPPGLRGDPEARAVALVARRSGGVPAGDLPLLLGVSPRSAEEIANRAGLQAIGGRLLTADAVGDMRQKAVETVRGFQRQHPEAAGLSLETLRRALPGADEVVEQVLAALVKERKLVSRDGMVSMPGFVPRLAGNPELIGRLLQVLESSGLEPPAVPELEAKLGQSGLVAVLRRMVADGQVVAVESERFFSTKALDVFVATLREVAQSQEVTPGAMRDRLGISRKYLIPLLEWADRSGITRRVGDKRVLA
jgi:selenocysteine-specific elongation factor